MVDDGQSLFVTLFNCFEDVITEYRTSATDEVLLSFRAAAFSPLGVVISEGHNILMPSRSLW